jgi:nucleotide-binding universal stress UspA family protein
MPRVRPATLQARSWLTRKLSASACSCSAATAVSESGRIALGSVVSEALRNVRTPVLVLKAASELFVNGLVCVGVDFSPSSEAALVAAAALAQRVDAAIAIVHVLPFGEHHSAGHERLRHEAFDRLEALRCRLVPSAVPSQSFAEMVPMGDPAATIVAGPSSSGRG